MIRSSIISAKASRPSSSLSAVGAPSSSSLFRISYYSARKKGGTYIPVTSRIKSMFWPIDEIRVDGYSICQ